MIPEGIGSMTSNPALAPGFADRIRTPSENASLEEVEKVAKDLEGVFFSMLVKQMRETMTEEGFFGEGAGMDNYAGLFDQMIGASMAQGGGLGIAELVVRQEAARKEAMPLAELAAATPESVEELGAES